VTSARVLIVNADDFGRSPAINAGVIRAHETFGIVTSASLMVRWAAAATAANYVRSGRLLDIGLHVDLGEWARDAAQWRTIYEVAPLEDAAAVEREVRFQLETFRELIGRDPTHLDSHQHVHRHEPMRSVLNRLGAELGVPVRHASARVRYCGNFYGQDTDGVAAPERLSPQALVDVIRSLPPGVTELVTHPAAYVDFTSQYAHERVLELRTLCDRRIPAAIDDRMIRLSSFNATRGS
jgi:chitin disaccharide deacetylase